MSQPHSWKRQLEIERELTGLSRRAWLASLSGTSKSHSALCRDFGIDRGCFYRSCQRLGVVVGLQHEPESVEVKPLPPKHKKPAKPQKPEPTALERMIANAAQSNAAVKQRWAGHL